MGRLEFVEYQTPNQGFAEFLEALRHETDRGAALAAAAFAEEILDAILSSFLADVPETRQLMDGFAAPIGSFSARIKLAYTLGLLHKELVDGLHIARQIRNKFAHQWSAVSFDDPSITTLVQQIPSSPILLHFQPSSPRTTFDNRLSAILMELCCLPELVKAHKRVPTRLIHYGKLHESKEAADAEVDEFRRSGKPPWESEGTRGCSR
jgi:hypothetical protein